MEQAGPAACSINYVPGDLSLHIYGGETGMQLPMATGPSSNFPAADPGHCHHSLFFFLTSQARIFSSPHCTDR